jgi:hypothetical protein
MRPVAISGTRSWPEPVPTLTMPDIMPRRLTNQRATVDSVMTSWVLKPIPASTPYRTYSCHGACSRNMSRYPSPNELPDTTSRTLGPILSFSLPASIPAAPMIRKASDDAPDIVALDQPNSIWNSLKKTP